MVREYFISFHFRIQLLYGPIKYNGRHQYVQKTSQYNDCCRTYTSIVHTWDGYNKNSSIHSRAEKKEETIKLIFILYLFSSSSDVPVVPTSIDGNSVI